MQKLNVTDGRWAFQYLPSRAFGMAGDNYEPVRHNLYLSTYLRYNLYLPIGLR